MFRILITIVLFITTANLQNICIPDNVFVESLLSSTHGSKLNLTMTDPSLNIIYCEELKISNKTGWTGGRLILSDSPEYASSRGKLYEDANLPATVEAEPNRIFMYHVNGKPKGVLKFAIFVTNLHPNESATLTMKRKGVIEPTKNYIVAGQKAFYLWLKSPTNHGQKIIKPLESIQLDSGYYQFDVQPEELLHGIYDYEITQNHKLTLCALESEDDPDICTNLSVLPRDRHIRGTFPSSDKHLNIIQNSSNSNVHQFPLADGVTDEFVSGVDATDGTVQINSGNYGVLYEMHFNISSLLKHKYQSQVGYLVNARGGVWAGAAGIIGLKGDEEAHLLPEVESGILRYNWEGALIGKFNTGMNIIMWMPTGGSNLPVRIVGVPVKIRAQLLLTILSLKGRCA